MNITQITKCLAYTMNQTASTSFSPITGLVVSSMSNRILYVSAPITQLPTANQAQYAVVEFTTGICTGLRCVIMQHAANPTQLIFADEFRGVLTPANGDTFQIYGGPMMSGNCNIFWLEQDAFSNIPDQNFIVTVGIAGGNFYPDRLNGRQLNGLMSYRQAVDLEVVILAPLVTANASNQLSYLSAVLDIYTVVEQVKVFISQFKLDTANNFSGRGRVEYSYFWATQETGTQPRQGCMFTFTLESAS